MSELVDSMQTLGFQDKNPLMFEIMLKISAKRKGGSTSFTQFAEDMADLIVSSLFLLFLLCDIKHGRYVGRPFALRALC